MKPYQFEKVDNTPSNDIREMLLAIPTLGSVRERLSYFACNTEAGELNTTLNNAMNYIWELEKEVMRLRGE